MRSRCLLLVMLAGGCAVRLPSGETGEESSSGPGESESGTTQQTGSSTETESGGETGGETQTATGTQSESETETGAAPQECESDEECSPGNCVDGLCEVCEDDYDCNEFCMEGSCQTGTCVFEPRDCSVSGCHMGYCGEGTYGGEACKIDLCEEYDGVVDVEITMDAVGWTPPAQLGLDQQVRVMKVEEPGCSFHIEVVRAIDGPLLLAESYGTNPTRPGWTEELVEAFGDDWDGLTAPLLVDYFDHEACPIIEDECGEYTRGVADFELEGENARIADRQVGWAPGGYFVTAPNLVFRDGFCQQLYGSWTLSVSIMRDACTDDCPPSTVHAGCFPPLDDWPGGGFDVSIAIEHWDYVYADFECVVIESVVEGTQHYRGLDCVPLLQPTEHPECEND